MIERSTHFVRQCELDGHNLIVPSVVVAEALIRSPIETHKELLRKLTEYFVIAPFDIAAATLYARMLVEQKGAIDEATFRNISKRQIKADFMIAATAVARSCHCIYTEDTELIKFASPYLKVDRVSKIALSAQQIPIFDEATPS